MKKVIELKEVKTYEVPGCGLELYNPSFRHITLDQVIKKTKDYAPFYNTGVFCRETATIHLYR